VLRLHVIVVYRPASAIGRLADWIEVFNMDISVAVFKQRCLEIIRQVERSGASVAITRRGKVVARLQPPSRTDATRNAKPREQLRAMGGRLLAKPGESVFRR
jgi:antitoxin (DNA-binding transcriptional repressor) of toxin-antitoxin stability system